jgi:hypothetical protein
VREERRESNFPNSNPRERKNKDYEDILAPNHLNISFACNYQYALALNVLNTTLILNSYLADVT